MKTRTWVGGIAAAWVLAAAGGCGGHAPASDAEAPADEAVVSVAVRAVETRRFEDVVTASGQWRSGGDVVVSAPVAGVVESLSVRIGDTVGAGQRLGSLITRESGAALKGAELLAREAHDPAGREEAERALLVARRDLVRVPLTAPQRGIVTRRSIEPGALAADGAEIVALVPAQAVVFEAHAAADQVSRVRPGQPATVLEPGGARRAAQVQRVLPMASGPDQAALVWLAATGGGAPPALERFGTATIVVGSAHLAEAVPDSALVEDDLTGERRVAVVDSAGRIAWTPVTLGGEADGWRELVRPRLAARTRVVVAGQRGLPDGTHVKPLP